MKANEEKLNPEDWIAYPVKFEAGCGMFFDAKNEHISDIRGWGRLQYLKNAEQIQDSIGIFIQDAINEKLNRRPSAREEGGE